ncbi:MAG TPA: pentapeptide repeat-containing protein, partial [Patescibacteria group bacterium]
QQNLRNFLIVKSLSLVCVGLLIGVAVSRLSIAHADSGIITACQNLNGAVRIIDTSIEPACKLNEKMISWSINSVSGGSSFVGSFLPNMSNADLHDIDIRYHNMATANFSSSNLTGALLSGSDFNGANFTGTNLYSVTVKDANFNNAIFTNANLLKTGGALAGEAWVNCTFSGATWNNTICPDGSNSNNNGNTCIGHGL